MNNCVSILRLCFLGLVFVLFLFSDEWAGGRGQVKWVGTSLSCRIQVRRADVSELPVYASEEEKALNSSEVSLA